MSGRENGGRLRPEILDADSSFPWDGYIRGSPFGCFSHLSAWMEALERFTGSRLHRLVVRRGEAVIGVWPVFVVRRGPFRFAYSPPVGGAVHHMGPVIAGYEALSQRKRIELHRDVQAAVDRFLWEDLECNYVELKGPPGFVDARPLQWAGYRVGLLFTYILDLTAGSRTLLARASSDLRRNLKKCEGRVECSDAPVDALREALRVVQGRYHDVGLSYPVTPNYVSTLFRLLGPDHIRLFTAGEHGGMDTALILAMQGARATIWHGMTKPRDPELPSNEYLTWHVINWARERGFRELEIMDADNPRLDSFKAKFGAEIVPCLFAERSRTWVRVAERLGRLPASLF